MNRTLLEPRAHNALVARWAWYACIDNNDDETDDDETYRIVRGLIEGIVKGEAIAADGAPSDRYAEILLEKITAAVGGPYAAARDRILRSYRPYLRKLAKANTDPFEKLCMVVAKAAAIWYRHHQVAVPKNLVSRLRIRIDHDPEPLDQSFESPFTGAAAVHLGCHMEQCCVGTKRHLQTLRLTLVPGSFEDDALSALPFVLFHECVSHVLQGPWDEGRQAPDPASQFAEGWMDLAARTVFEHVLHNRFPCERVELIPHEHRRDFFESGGRRMCDARHKVSSRLARAANRRTEGWRAATNTLQAMQRAGIPDEVFLQLSFELNTSDLSPAERDTLVQRFRAAFNPDQQFARQSAKASLLAALVRYHEDGCLERLIETARTTATLNGRARLGLQRVSK